MNSRLALVVLCSALVLAAQPPAVTISSADLKINPASTDTYNIQGSISGITLNNAQAIVFSAGQFGASIPLSAFVQQPGTNVYQYNDATGMSPYWVSSLTIDLDANQFTAGASGIVLSGLSNPFALQVGADTGSACGIVRVQSTSAGEYQLNPSDPPTQPCLMPSAPVADPPAVSIGVASQVTIRTDASGLDAGSANLFRADDNAQPVGNALCTFSDRGDGTSFCNASFNESGVGVIPLVVQATVGGQPVLAPGFSIQAVAPVSAVDMQQRSDVQNIMLNTGDQAYSQYGDSVQARVQVMSALRQYMQAQPGLTGQPVSLSPFGAEIGVLCDSGYTVTYNMSDPDGGDPGAPPASQSQRKSQNAAAGNADASPFELTERLSARPNAQKAEQCGDFQRDIVANNQVLVWDPGSLFFPGQDAAPAIAQVLQSSRCPHFSVTPLYGPQASLAAISQFSNYGTVIMNTHGIVNPWGRFYIVTGSPSASTTTEEGDVNNPIEIGSACFNNRFGLPGRCFVTVYANYKQWQIAPNTIVYGGFCNGFIGKIPAQPGNLPLTVFSQFPPKLAPTPTNAFIGFNFPVYTNVNQAAGMAVFNSLVNSYTSASEAKADAAAAGPNLNIYPPDSNLAYVGNPRVSFIGLPPSVPGSLPMAAFLDGTQSCDGSNDPQMAVKFQNPAQAGHLKPRSALVTGPQDMFTSYADQDYFVPIVTPGASTGGLHLASEAEYTPDSTLPANSDNIMADFYPDLANRLAARACITAAGNGLFVAEQLAALWDDQQPSQIPGLTEIVPPKKITQTYTVPVSDPGGNASKGAKASVTVTPNGEGKWTVTLNAGGADPNYKGTPGAPGPYQGRAQIELLAINPGAAGKAMVKVDVQVQNSDVCQSSLTPNCTIADGSIVIGDSQSKTVESGSIFGGDKNAVSPSFSVTADSSCSGQLQPTPQCPIPSPVKIGVSLTEATVSVPNPALFSVTLNIEFVNQ